MEIRVHINFKASYSLELLKVLVYHMEFQVTGLFLGGGGIDLQMQYFKWG